MLKLISDQILGIYAAIVAESKVLRILVLEGEDKIEGELGRHIVGIKVAGTPKISYENLSCDAEVPEFDPEEKKPVEEVPETQKEFNDIEEAKTTTSERSIEKPPSPRVKQNLQGEKSWWCTPPGSHTEESRSMVMSGFKVAKASLSITSYFKKAN